MGTISADFLNRFAWSSNATGATPRAETVRIIPAQRQPPSNSRYTARASFRAGGTQGDTRRRPDPGGGLHPVGVATDSGKARDDRHYRRRFHPEQGPFAPGGSNVVAARASA